MVVLLTLIGTGFIVMFARFILRSVLTNRANHTPLRAQTTYNFIWYLNGFLKSPHSLTHLSQFKVSFTYCEMQEMGTGNTPALEET